MKAIKILCQNGCSENLAIFLRWAFLTSEQKKSLSLEQLQWVWRNTPSGTPEKAEALTLVKEKAETLLAQYDIDT